MSLIFKPTGTLDINTDPAMLADGAMQRCKNMRLDIPGAAKTRYGSSKVNSTALVVAIGHLVEQAGYRFALGTSIYRNETSIGSGYNNKNWSSILYNAYNSTTQNIFALNGSDRIRIAGSTIYNWGVDAPTQIYTISALTATSGLTGAYNIKISFARLESTTVVYESNQGSAAASSVTLTAQALRVEFSYASFTSLDSQITHIRLYRTLTNGSIYYLDKTIALADIPFATSHDYAYTSAFEATDAYISGTGANIAGEAVSTYYGTYTWEPTYSSADNVADYFVNTGHHVENIYFVTATADASLGAEGYSTHDRPPAGSVVIGPNFDGYSFILKNNLVYFSLAKQPEHWPDSYYIEASPPQFNLQAGCFYNGQLYVASKHEIYNISGTGPQTFFPVPMSASTGAQGRYGMLGLNGVGIFHVGSDGIYIFMAAGDRKMTADAFDRVFRGETVNGVPGVGSLTSAWIIQFKNKIYFGYAGASNTYPRNVLVFDLENKKTVYYDWGIEIPAVCVDRENDRLLCVDSSGYIWHVEQSARTSDNGTAISWEIESKDFTLSTRAHFPRWVKYDVDAVNATGVTGKLILDGAVQQSHTITGDRITKRRLVATGNGERCSMRVTGSGAASVYAVESE